MKNIIFILCLSLSPFVLMSATQEGQENIKDEQRKEFLCVSQPKARLREGPSTKTTHLRTIYKHTPLIKLGHEDRWYHIEDHRGRKAYVFDSLVKPTDQCALVLGGAKTFKNSTTGSAPYERRPEVHHQEGLKIIENDIGQAHVVDRFGNEFWVGNSKLWPPKHRIQIKF
jgi:hypothetical protein